MIECDSAWNLCCFKFKDNLGKVSRLLKVSVNSSLNKTSLSIKNPPFGTTIIMQWNHNLYILPKSNYQQTRVFDKIEGSLR